MEDSARTSVRTNDVHSLDAILSRVMSFMGRGLSQRHYGKTRAVVSTIARERIEILVMLAKEMAFKDEDLSRRYVDLARRISSRTKVRIPGELKRFLCKGCGIALVPGHNAKIRLRARSSGIVVTCLRCGFTKRYPVARKTASANGRSSMKPYIAQTSPFPKKNHTKE